MIEDIIGTPDKNDTIKFLQARIEYIERNLQMDLDQQKELRKQYVTELMLKSMKSLTYITICLLQLSNSLKSIKRI